MIYKNGAWKSGFLRIYKKLNKNRIGGFPRGNTSGHKDNTPFHQINLLYVHSQLIQKIGYPHAQKLTGKISSFLEKEKIFKYFWRSKISNSFFYSTNHHA